MHNLVLIQMPTDIYGKNENAISLGSNTLKFAYRKNLNFFGVQSNRKNPVG